MSVLHITEQNFETTVTGADRPLLIDFWATWCGPCQMMAPILDDYAATHPEVLVAKVNVDEESGLAAAFGIQSIPTLIVIKDGKATAMAVGVQTAEQLDDLIAR